MPQYRPIQTFDLQYSSAGGPVLRGVSITVPPGRRIGLLGENGAGKSTLLRLIAGELTADAGRVERPSRTGLLRQEVELPAELPVSTILDESLAEPRAIARELEEAATALGEVGDPAAAERYDRALAEAERADVWSIDARLGRILAGLGLSDLPLDRRIGEISGGQRARIALAALLLRRPDALLLDEPSNHLDDDAVAFLERELSAWAGPVLFASHDRAVLDAVATDLVDLDALGDAPSTSFGGGYSSWLEHKAAERRRWEEAFQAEQEELAALRAAVAVTSRSINHDRPRRDNNTMAFGMRGDRVEQQISRRIRNAAQRLDVLEANPTPRPPAPLTFSGIPTGATALAEESGALVTLSDIRVPGRLALDRLDIAPTTRLLITGPNGAGKSTLLAVLAGTLGGAGPSGSIRRRRGLRVGLLQQDVRYADPSRSPRELYQRMLGAERAERLPLSGLGLIAPRDVDRAVGQLSIGQQRRLALALVIARPPHLFLLDEPTNHLSLTLAEELEQALGSYPGAVVIASHDRWLRRRWRGDELALPTAR